MIFGQVIKSTTPFKYNVETGYPPVLLIHNVALGAEQTGSTSLYIRKDGQ